MTLTTRCLLALAFACALTPGNVRGQTSERALYEQILFPIAKDDIPGPLGSRLNTRGITFNRNPFSVNLHPVFGACSVTCTSPKIGPGEGSGVRHFVVPPASLGALLLLFKADAPQNVSFSTHLYDPNRPGWGVEIPVIRESEYRTGLIDLLSVPLSSRYIVTLRVYDPDPPRSRSFRVRVWDRVLDGGAYRDVLLGERSVTPTFPGQIPNAPLPLYFTAPPTAELKLSELVTATDLTVSPDSLVQRRRATSRASGALNVNPPNTVRIEIEPEDPDTKYWAFALVESTEAFELTTITPH